MLQFKIVRDHFADPEWEGDIPFMYLDSVNKVTVGIGCLLSSVEDAEALGFVYREDLKADGSIAKGGARKGDTASKSAIAKDYQDVAGQAGQGWAAKSFKAVTLLDLPTDAIDSLFYGRVATFEQNLKGIFTDYDSFPAPAQLALMDMVFNLGTHGLVSKFPALVEAAKKRDWSQAAAECHRKKPIPERRNSRTAELFSEAADDEKVLQQHKKPTGKVMPPRVLTQPHAWYDPAFDVLEEMYQKLKSELLPPRAQGRR
jgi:GH24 family phage-related lysozyme (muramidase)